MLKLQRGERRRGSRQNDDGVPRAISVSAPLILLLCVHLLITSLVVVMMVVGRSTEAPIAWMPLGEAVLSRPSVEALREQGYMCTMRNTSVPSVGSYATEVCSRQGSGGVLAFVEVYFKSSIHCGTLLTPLPRTVRVGDVVLLWGKPQQGEGNAPRWWVEYGTPIYTPYYLNYERFVRHIHLSGQIRC